jgi:hypothetical protein
MSEEEYWIAGWLYAANVDMDYDQYDDEEMQVLAKREYEEWKTINRSSKAGG